MEGPDRQTDLARAGKGNADKGRRTTNRKTKSKRRTLRFENAGVADVVSAEESPAGIYCGAGAHKDSLVREESHPFRTAVNTRVVGTNSAGDTKWKPMLDSVPRRKIALQRARTPAASWKVDRQIASTATGGERKSQANKDNRLDVFHRGKPPEGDGRRTQRTNGCPTASASTIGAVRATVASRLSRPGRWVVPSGRFDGERTVTGGHPSGRSSGGCCGVEHPCARGAVMSFCALTGC